MESDEPVELIDSLERFSDGSMKCCICYLDLREKRGFREFACCNSCKLCEDCEYKYIHVGKNTKSPCCQSETPHIANIVSSIRYKYIVSYEVNQVIQYMDPADYPKWRDLESQRNEILERSRARMNMARERERQAEQERLERIAREREAREREARERWEQVMRTERERRELVERTERERREQVERTERERRAQIERTERERWEQVERERREQEEYRQNLLVSIVQQQIDSAGGISGFVGNVRHGIPCLDFYKTVREKAPHRVHEAIASLENEISKLSQSSRALTPDEQTNLTKFQKWRFVMTMNPVHNTELDRIWSTIWDNRSLIKTMEDKPPAVFDRTTIHSELVSTQHPVVNVMFDCNSTFTFTFKQLDVARSVQYRIPVHTELHTSGLHPIAMNIVTYENVPDRQAENAGDYIAVAYSSPNSEISSKILLYQFSVIEPIFEGHSYDIMMEGHQIQTVALSTDVTNVRKFKKLAIDFDNTQRQCQYKFVYVFS